jgi:hypothetical protein
VAALDADYDWIAKEKHLFGSAEYDFSSLDPRKAYEEYKAAGERLQQLREKGIQRQVRQGRDWDGVREGAAGGGSGVGCFCQSQWKEDAGKQGLSSLMRLLL